MVENRFVGMKSRGVYETPGGAISCISRIGRCEIAFTMDREVMHQRDALIPKYAELVYNGFWYAPERLALQAYVTESQKNVTGTVRVKLYKGNLMVSGRQIPGEPLQLRTSPRWKPTRPRPTTRTTPPASSGSSTPCA